MSGISVTQTAPGMSRREIAIAVIADKLGIAAEKVTDDTDLGEAWREMGPVLAIKLGRAIMLESGMHARDIFAQI
jgi:hypothetical protein